MGFYELSSKLLRHWCVWLLCSTCILLHFDCVFMLCFRCDVVCVLENESWRMETRWRLWRDERRLAHTAR